MLVDSRDALLAQGFYVPTSMGKGEHVDLVNIVVDSGKKFSRRKALGLKTPEQIDAFKKKRRRKIMAELERAAHPDRTLVISSERFFSTLTLEDELDALRDILGSCCARVEIVCYLRPQHEFAQSIYTTLLRNGYNRPNVLPALGQRSREARKYNYNRVLSFWEDGFSADKITLRRFQSARLEQGNAVNDFMKVVGIDPDPITIPDNQNTSLSARGQLVLRAFNTLAPRGGPVRDKLRAELVKVLERVASGKGATSSLAEKRAFFDHYTRSNQQIQKRYFPDEDTLFDDPFKGKG